MPKHGKLMAPSCRELFQWHAHPYVHVSGPRTLTAEAPPAMRAFAVIVSMILVDDPLVPPCLCFVL